MAEDISRDRLSLVLGLFALGNLTNGVWMLLSPTHWYHKLPAAVPDFGPLNEHFVRDLGTVFVMMALVLG